MKPLSEFWESYARGFLASAERPIHDDAHAAFHSGATAALTMLMTEDKELLEALKDELSEYNGAGRT